MTHREALLRVTDQILDNREYARSSRGDYNSNLLYDQQGILLRYMGMNPDMWLPVKLQHGWGDESTGEFFCRETILSEGNPVFVWGDRLYDNLLKYEVKPTRIGAPVLYAGIDVSWVEPDRNSCIFFPAHGCDDVWITNYDTLDTLRAAIPADRITVCLHPHDWNASVVDTLRRFGYDVTTCGGNLRQGFLWRCLALIAAHGFVASNAVGTAPFFAGLVGRPFVIAGAEPIYNADWNVHSREWTRDNFPELLTLSDRPNSYWQKELGVEHVRKPDELRRIIAESSVAWNEGELEQLGLWRR